jgi:arylsulfatase A-like enzyme
VVIFMLDTLRPDHLETMGYDRQTAPFLAEIAQESAVFDRAISTSSWTAPATASALTGLYPHRHGVISGLLAPDSPDEQRDGSRIWPLDPDVRTIAGAFQEAGRRTYGLSSNFNMGPELRLDRGFERFERVMGLEASDVEARLADWLPVITAPNGPPYLLYLHFNDPHEPYNERDPWHDPSTYTGEYAAEMAAYDSEISYLDAALRRTWEALEAGAEARGRPVVLVVLSDHGEAFGEHGTTGHPGILFREVNRVLFMVRSPRLGVAPGHRQSMVSLVDLAPTLLELTRLSPLESSDGLSMVDLLVGGEQGRAQEQALQSRTLFAHRLDPDQPLLDGSTRELWAALRGDRKIIMSPEGLQWMEPWKGVNEAPIMPPQDDGGLVETLESWRASLPKRAASSREVLDSETAEGLKVLGY